MPPTPLDVAYCNALLLAHWSVRHDLCQFSSVQSSYVALSRLCRKTTMRRRQSTISLQMNPAVCIRVSSNKSVAVGDWLPEHVLQLLLLLLLLLMLLLIACTDTGANFIVHRVGAAAGGYAHVGGACIEDSPCIAPTTFRVLPANTLCRSLHR